MAKIFVSFNISGVTDNCFLVARELSNPGAEVYRSAVLVPPHGQRNITIDNLDPVMHRVEVWTTLDNVTLNQILGACDIDASIEGTGLNILQFIVDRGLLIDPSSSDDTYFADGTNGRPSLDGVTYLVNKPAYGPLVWDVDIEHIPGGGFHFINGDMFNNGEAYTLWWTTSQQINPTTNVSDISDVFDIINPTTLGGVHRGGLINFKFSDPGAVITLPDAVSIPNRTAFTFNTHQGNQINGEVKFQAGQGVYFRGAFRNSVYLGKNEELKIVAKNGEFHVVHYNGEADRVGQIIFERVNDRKNRMLCDGTEYDGLIYKRIWDWITNELPANQKVDYTTWGTPVAINGLNVFVNKGFFAIDLINNKFKVPDLNNLFIRSLKTGSADTERFGSNIAGSYQHFQMQMHGHAIRTGASPINSGDDNDAARCTGHGSVNTRGQADNTGITPKTIVAAGGLETRGANSGAYPCLII